MAAPTTGIVWGDIAGDNRGRIGIYTNLSNTETQTAVNVQVWVWTRYSTTDSANKFYYDIGPAVTSAVTNLGSVNIKHTVDSSWSTSNQTKILDETYTYTRGTSAVTYTIYSKLQGVDWVNAIMHAKTTFVVPALTSYTVSYNANGGSGAPAAQTKWHGQNLTLSGTKPTRTGHSFAHWLSSAQNQAYNPGALYGHNQSTTMVAQWTANTYTITFNANGGSGAPSNQTKTYGVDLVLSSTIPTRTNYKFLGWSTAASAVTPSYTAGGTYSVNSATTLYAVWELAYTIPSVSNVKIYRCTETGSSNDYGTYVMVSFDWSCDQNIGENNVTSVRISYKESAASTWTDVDVSATGTNGSVSQIVGDSSFSVDNAYNFKIEVIDSMDGMGSAAGSIAGARFPIDILAQGKGVAIGKPAEKEAFEVALTQYDKFDTLVGNGLAAYGGSGDAAIDPDTTLEGLCLTNHANAPQGAGTFFYIHTLFYSTKSETAARTQIAYPYNKAGSLYYRYYKSGAWEAWNAIGGGGFDQYEVATSYPTKAGIYRLIGTNIFANLQNVSPYGVLVIFKAEYGLHMYLDAYGSMSIGYSGDTFQEPTKWNIVDGLGTTTSKTVTSVAALDDLTGGGWYFFSLSGTTINNVTFNYASVFVCPTNAKTSCFQELRPLATNYVLRRYLHSGTWSEWEIDNPPMAVGKEYRTSERWNGAVVYRKVLSYAISSQVGSTSNSTNLTIAHGVSNISHIVRAHASRNRYSTSAAGYLFPSVSANGGVIALQNFDATNVTMRFYKDYLGGGTIYIDMAYTKS